MKTAIAILLVYMSLTANTMAGPAGLVIDAGKGPNPWTSLDIKDSCNTVRFVVFSDRNGGNRPGVYPEAIRRANLLDPQFVMCVGDFITGYTEDRKFINSDWEEVARELKALKAPFFYTVGNHDQTNPVESEEWAKRFGRSYYHFIYKNVLFLVVNSEDEGYSNIRQDQLDYFRKVLADNPNPRWTFMFLHKPFWDKIVEESDGKDNGNGVQAFLQLEAMLKGRKYTVFAGHTHQYCLDVRNGNKYYTLATSGAGTDLRGQAYGEFDEIVSVSVGEGEPVIANLDYSGFVADDAVIHSTKGIPEKLKDSAPHQGSALVSQASDVDAINMKFTSKNTTTVPVSVSIEFGRTAPFKLLVANPLVTVIQPGKAADINIAMKAPHMVPIAEIGAIPYEWTVTAQPKGKRPIVMSGKADIGYDQLRPARRAITTMVVDGKLGDWKELPYALTEPSDNAQHKGLWKNLKDLSASFNVAYDDKFVYVGVKVADDSINSVPGVDPWNQDGIGISVEGRGDTDFSPEKTGKSQSFYLSPGRDAKSTIVWGQEWVPAGVQTACVTAKGGYAAEVAIPVGELQQSADKPWQALRVNISLYDFDRESGNTGTYMSWQTDWKDPSSHPGSGAFIRK